jgi:hypothetical protein
MTAMFPDSGVPPGEAKNSIPDPDTQNCQELWYSTSRCAPRFDPAAANAVLAEMVNLINAGEVSYDCNFLDQVQLAVRYLSQRGLMSGVVVAMGDVLNKYTAALSPTATRYNNFMTLRICPDTNNSGAILLNVDGLGDMPVLRNDAQPLQSFDWLAGIPCEIIFFNGAWFMVGLCKSQIPIKKFGEVLGWVRTDGNDETGDGTANTPDKAFRTIAKAFQAIGDRYAPSPLLSITIRLGIPGRYEGCSIGPYGGTVTITGDKFDKANYIIAPAISSSGTTDSCIAAYAVRLAINGVNLVGDVVSNNWSNYRVRTASQAWANDCQMTLSIDQPNGAYWGVDSSGQCGGYGTNHFIGNGHSAVGGIIASSGQFLGSNNGGMYLSFSNTTFSSGGMICNNLGVIILPATTIQQGGCAGPRYLVTDNSIIRASGQTLPGNAAGAATEHGLYFP